MTLQEKVREEIDQLIDKAGSVFAFSSKSNIRPETIYRIRRGLNPSIATLEKLEDYKSRENSDEVINN